jgi:predicted lipoprotein with Yx(FWY)xxD motif
MSVKIASLVAATTLLTTGCTLIGAAPAPRPSMIYAQGAIRVRALPGMGEVLTNSAGFTLYVFEPDGHQIVSCTDACAGSWPPLFEPPAGLPPAGPGVRTAMIGAAPDPDGGQVITYAGWPLYTYASDLAPGQANGQALNLNGGPWYVIHPSGQVVEPTGAS